MAIRNQANTESKDGIEEIIDMSRVEASLRWIFKRIMSNKSHFKPLATNGFETSGRGSVVVQIQFEHLMAHKGDQLQVAYIPDKMIEDIQNDILTTHVQNYKPLHKEFVLTVISRKESKSFVASEIVTDI